MSLSWMKGVDDGRPIFPTYIEAIVQAVNGNYVVEGLDVVPQSGTLNVDVASGKVMYNNVLYDVPAVTLTLDSEQSGRVRHDLIVWDSTDQTVKVIKGSEFVTLSIGTISKVPNCNPEWIPLAIVRVNGDVNQLSASDVFDTRLGIGTKVRYSIVEVNSDYSADSNQLILVDASSGNVTVTLPLPEKGYDVIVKKVDDSSNIVYVVSNSGEYIDDVTQLELAMQGEAYRLIGDGTKWHIV